MHSVDYLKFFLAFIFIISIMVLLGMAARRFGLGTVPARRPGQKKRLQVIDALPLDSKRRVYLISRDNKEHLILTGGANDTIIETDIPHPEDVIHETSDKK